MTNHRGIRIISDTPIRADGNLIVLAAEDEHGALQICMTPEYWEMLQAEAPLPGNAADRRDHALAMAEMFAAERPPAECSTGERISFIG